MIVITGAAGFIGSNIAAELNREGCSDLVLVDHLENTAQLSNLHGLKYKSWLSPTDFLDELKRGLGRNITAIIHQGACSDTTCLDWSFLYQNNYMYTKALVDFCLESQVKLVYASSASVYGMGIDGFKESVVPSPINFYAFSKALVDHYVERALLQHPDAKIFGLRYFNVYGINEQHKEQMSSVMFHFRNQIKTTGVVKLFEGYDGIDNGEQRRDFIYVSDVVDLNMRFLSGSPVSGIYNAGTGRTVSYNEIAEALINVYGRGAIEYVKFPDHLKGRYQSYTCSDNTKVQEAVGSFECMQMCDALRQYTAKLDGN